MAHENVYKSSLPFSGSLLYYTTIKPSTTTSETAPVIEEITRHPTNTFTFSYGK
jgi:hypothetical protein